ncbi:MAG: glycosyltransferase [Chitinophagaceae bacterium]|nr:glycosyltransferase [Chitinophagaceae bacterium]
MDIKIKKVLFISYDGMTDQLGQSQVIPYLARLSALGYHITILSVEKKEKYLKNGDAIRQLLNRSGIQWEFLYFSTRPPFLSKLYDQFKLNRKAAELYRKNKYNLIHCRSYVAADAGVKINQKFGVPFLFDMRGFWVDERVDSGLWNLKNPLYHFLYRRYKKKEKVFLKKSAHIISLTLNAKQELALQYEVPDKKITVIPCCADLDHFDYTRVNTADQLQYRKQWGMGEQTKIISYLGSLGGWYMTGEMLDFYQQYREKEPDSRFLFITHDPAVSILKLAAERGIPAESVIVQPASRDQVPLFLSLSNWSVFFIRDLYSKKASSPTKQGEIMGMGIPLLCNDIGDTGDIVRKSESGLVIAAFSKADYANAIEEMSVPAKFNQQLIREKAFSFFDLDTGVERYQKVYEEVMK